MRWTLISFLCIVTISNVIGQNQVLQEKIEAQSPVNIGLDKVIKSFTPAPLRLKSANSESSHFIVDFVNFPEEAKQAFQYAVSIWEQSVVSPVTIRVVATWEKLDGNIIAQSRPSVFYKNFIEAPFSEVYYPVALVEKLAGKEFNDSKEPDIICSFNSYKSFYFGTDGNTATSQYDFVTVVLHELAHGLGISGFISDDNGMGKINNPTSTPSAYDYYLFNTNQQRITDNTFFKSPSSELHNQLISDKLNFCSALKSGEISNSNIYAPTIWNNGASIYHLKEKEYQQGIPNELMKPFSYKGEAIHNPGNTTLMILSEIGWGKVLYKLDEIKDFEETCAELPIHTSVLSGQKINQSTLNIVYSTTNFTSQDSVLLTFNPETQKFEGKLPIDSYKGKIQYFFTATAENEDNFTYPNNAPKNILSFKIGPDYYPPTLIHNPSKIVSGQEIDFSAIASDNVGIQSVKIEYKINGNLQEPFELTTENGNLFKGKLNIAQQLRNTDVVEYRVIAEDNTSRRNKKSLPATGFYNVEVFESFQPTSGYYSDFNSNLNDFTTTDFEINTPVGFSNGNLHTGNPYIVSAVESEKYNLIAQLKYPIILEENGQMSFDEIVLVEPGLDGTNFTDENFLDFVIVEASKNNGKSWTPVVDGYDSRVNENWKNQFSNSLKSSTSSASGHENMFWEQKINLTSNPAFAAGDTVLFRFRLASDKSISGWGWAIDNLKIQNVSTGNNEIAENENVNIYPNPFSNNIFIDCNNMVDQASVDIKISDLTGKIVYRETNFDIKYNSKLKVDLSTVKSGIYLASITDSDFNTITKRIIKH